MVEVRNITYFARLGIPVPQIVGYGRQRILGLFIRGGTIDFDFGYRSRRFLVRRLIP
jgi:hypothetical protein